MSSKLKLEVVLAAVDKLTRPLKSVSTTSKQTTKEVRELQSKLKALQDTSGKVDKFRQVSQAIGVTSAKLKDAQDHAKRLATEFAATAKPTAAMRKELNAAKEAVRQLKGAHTQQIQKQQELRASLQAAGVDTKKLASADQQLKQNTAAVTAELEKQKAALAKVNEQQRKLHAAKAQYDKSMATRNKVANAGGSALAAGAATGAAVAAPVMAYATAEDAATQMRVALMKRGGQVTADYEKINALANELGNRLPGTTADFQNMMTMLIRQGLPAQNILTGVGTATAYLGVQMKMVPEQAAEFTAKLQDATRTANEDMLGLTDTIQRAYYLGVDPNNMLEAYKGLGPTMDMIKRKGLDGANAMAPFMIMMDQAGMRGESAGNAINKVIKKGLDVDKIQKVQQALAKSKGIKLDLDFTDGKGEFGGFEKMMAQLSKLKKLDTVTRMQVLSDLYGDDKETNEVLSKIIEKGQAGYDDVLLRMKDQADLQSRVNVQLGTLKNLWDAASGTFTNTLVAFGEAIAPELKAVTQWIGQTAEATGRWAKENPVLSNAIMKTIAILAVLLVSFGAVATAIAAFLGPLAMAKMAMTTLGISLGSGVGTIGLIGNAIKWLGGVFATVGRALIMNPIGAIITAIAVAAYLIYEYWEPIKTFMLKLWSAVDGIFEKYPLLNYLVPIIGIPRLLFKHWDTLAPYFMKVFNYLKFGLLNFTPAALIYKAWNALAPYFATIWEKVKAIFYAYTPLGWVIRNWSTVRPYLEMLWNGIVAHFQFIWHAIETVLKWDPLVTLRTVWHGVTGWFTGIGGQMVDGMIAGFTARWDAAVAKIKELIKQLPEGAQKVLQIHSPSRVFAAIGGHTVDGLTVGLQRGQSGPLAAVSSLAKRLTAAGAGLALSTGTALAGQLDSRPAMASGASAAALPPMEIHIHAAPGMDEKALARLVQQEIAKALRGQRPAGNRTTLTDRD